CRSPECPDDRYRSRRDHAARSAGVRPEAERASLDYWSLKSTGCGSHVFTRLPSFIAGLYFDPRNRRIASLLKPKRESPRKTRTSSTSPFSDTRTLRMMRACTFCRIAIGGYCSGGRLSTV